MRLNKREMLLISFMLFSLFFGAGNLIFPPFLGQNAGDKMPIAIAGFLITAVILPVLGVIVVAEFGGLENLAAKVNSKFAFVFTLLIYLSIGPGLGIPRAASVPFEMAVAPYLNENSPLALFMLGYSLVFFIIACWLALNPNKLVKRIGNFLTPSLLALISILFISFLIKGEVAIASAQSAYATNTFMKGFSEGYQTMDTIAALNFGLVISTTLASMGLKEKQDIMSHTIKAGINAGLILALVYLMLSYMGMSSSGVYAIPDNGAWTLRAIVFQLFGNGGAILLASIFTLACLTTCVGLITSISQFFSSIFKRFTYNQFVYLIVAFSFIICNQGLTTILSISVPILNAIYPISIVLIILGLSDKTIKKYPLIYPITIFSTSIISIIYALDCMNVSLGFISNICSYLPFYKAGFGWVNIALVAALSSTAIRKKGD